MPETNSTESEILEVVDSHDRVIGTASRAEIHRKRLCHRAVHIFVFNTAGEIYVQRRSSVKDRHPLKLDSSAAGHVDRGEPYHAAAVRELYEELAVDGPLEEVLRIAACPETDNEHVRLYKAVIEARPVPNPNEIQWGGFVPPGRLTEMMEENPGDFVPAFRLLWREFIRIGK